MRTSTVRNSEASGLRFFLGIEHSRFFVDAAIARC
jgi:hypothetical protein